MAIEEQLRALTRLGDAFPRIHRSPETCEGWVDKAPRLLLAGVDTVHFSFAVEVSEAIFLRLLGEQHLARLAHQQRTAAFCSEWLNARVAPTGVKGYAILIEREDWSIKVAYDNPTRPPIFVEMRSLRLHLHPDKVLGACEDACAFIRDALLAS